MSKYQNIQPRTLTELMKDKAMIDLITVRHLPRQVMALDQSDNTLFNFEYPAFPFTMGLFSGPEKYADDVGLALKEILAGGANVNEIYYLGTRLEYEKLVDVVRILKEAGAYEHSKMSCFYVKPDVESLRSEIVLTSATEASDSLLQILDELDSSLDAMVQPPPDEQNQA